MIMDIVTNLYWCEIPGKMLRHKEKTLSSHMGYVWLSFCAFITLVPASMGESCHQRAMTVCFEQYNSHIQHQLENQDQHFYKGIDVEILRTICHSMQSAVHCTLRKCPGLSQDALLDVLPSDVTNVIDLCVYPQIYEVYARNQFCLSQLEPSLQTCHDNYEDATSYLLDSINTEHSPGVQPMCSELSKLVKCIEESVAQSCSAEAKSLVELLVRPSIQYSQFCPKQSVSTAAPTTTTMVPTRTHYRYQERPSGHPQENLETDLSGNRAESAGVSVHRTATVLFISLLTLVLARCIRHV